eukprot:7386152-Prymnesium_polylepis.1
MRARAPSSLKKGVSRSARQMASSIKLSPRKSKLSSPGGSPSKRSRPRQQSSAKEEPRQQSSAKEEPELAL